MNYKIFILPRAQRELASLPRESYERVRTTIYELAQTPRPQGCIKLSGREGWRLRIGDYRVLYLIEDETRIVTVVHVGHRSHVYR